MLKLEVKLKALINIVCNNNELFSKCLNVNCAKFIQLRVRDYSVPRNPNACTWCTL